MVGSRGDGRQGVRVMMCLSEGGREGMLLFMCPQRSRGGRERMTEPLKE